MDIVIMYLIALVMGAIGGIVHQLHDSEQLNDKKSVLRSIVMGAISAILTVAIYPVADTNTLVVSSFIIGWFGDSVILNIIRRGGQTPVPTS